MTRPILYGLLCCLLVPGLSSAQPSLQSADKELLVKFSRDISPEEARRDLNAAGVQSTHYVAALRLHHCRIVSNQDVASAVQTCQAHAEVEYAEPNYIYTASALPDDPRFAEQWSLHDEDSADIDAPEAWQVTTGARRIIVAVIDTGIDTRHPDLSDNIWRNPGETGDGRESNGIDDDDNGYIDDVQGWNFFADDNNVFDDNGHGTHVAGIIGARGNNGLGISGVAWETSLLPLKFLNRNGAGSASDAIAAILYAAANGARIINASWGGPSYSQALSDAIEYARMHKVLVVTAAGNESRDNDRRPTYPAGYDIDNVLSVASSDRNDELAEYSNFGTTTVDLAAPGSAILSTVPNNDYRLMSGTSMAAPHVSGVAALLATQFPSLHYRQTMIRLVGGAEPLQSLAQKTRSGGRLNAYGALSTHPRVAFVRRLRPPSGSTIGTIVQAEVTDQDSVRSVLLHYATDGGDYRVVDMQHQRADIYRGLIPLQPNGTRVEYFVRGVDIDGNTGLSATRRFQADQR